MSDTDPAYMGREACGHVVAVMVDNPAHKRDTAREIARWIRDGLTIERGTVAEAREALYLRKHPRGACENHTTGHRATCKVARATPQVAPRHRAPG